MLFDLAGAIATVAGLQQIYHFDAYGIAIGFNPSQATTTYLYSGEQFDPRIQMQYLRARYYHPMPGRFAGLDPYAGNINNPQSFHKYLYTHADPVNAIDPSGRILIFFDGTTNDEADMYAPSGVPGQPEKWSPTNIYKLYRIAKLSNMRHVRYYRGVGNDIDWGAGGFTIGTASTSLTKTHSQGTGFGMGDIIEEAMQYIGSTAYAFASDPEAKVLNVFGFSRGGIQATELTLRVERDFPQMEINFVGLFDPVGSVGMPGNFHRDVRGRLASKTKVAWQAIAADEDRSTFPATFIPGASFRWFKGQHGDVGGGWAEHGLSDSVLAWMHSKAKAAGLAFVDLHLLNSLPDLPVVNGQAQQIYAPDPNAPSHSNSYSSIHGSTGVRALRNTVQSKFEWRSSSVKDAIDFYKGTLSLNYDYYVDINDARRQNENPSNPGLVGVNLAFQVGLGYSIGMGF